MKVKIGKDIIMKWFKSKWEEKKGKSRIRKAQSTICKSYILRFHLLSYPGKKISNYFLKN